MYYSQGWQLYPALSVPQTSFFPVKSYKHHLPAVFRTLPSPINSHVMTSVLITFCKFQMLARGFTKPPSAGPVFFWIKKNLRGTQRIGLLNRMK